MKIKFFKRIFCIFLAVVILFFSINNSYFSPHKMDKSEAVEIGITYISIELIIELICAIGITGLSCALIDNVKDWDWEDILNDLHDWCRENYEILDQYVTDGANALKEWALADEWVVVEGGGGSAPNPSPGKPNPFKNILDMVWGGLDWTIANMLAVGGLAGEALNEMYGSYSEYAKSLFERTVVQDEGVTEIAKTYVEDKIDNFIKGNPLSLIDPVSESLQECFVSSDIEYNGDFLQDSSGNYITNYTGSFTYQSTLYGLCKHDFSGSSVSSGLPFAIVDTKTGIYNLYCVNDNVKLGFSDLKFIGKRINTLYIGTPSERSNTYDYNSYMLSLSGAPASHWLSLNVPVFLSIDDAKPFIESGDDSNCINRVRKYNYIDTDDAYGWASTADLSPADLYAANPNLADYFNGKDVSIASLIAAINALKARLEEQNPNKDNNTDSITYPDVPTYASIVDDVIHDPDISPSPVPSSKPSTGSDSDTDSDDKTDTGKDYIGLIGIIIDLLKAILQAIKDFMSWFIIDFDLIKAHALEAVKSVPAFSGFEPVLGYIDDFRTSITDSYEYPVIAIKTPEILLPFYPQAEIILVDFKDYATYFIWLRTFLAFSICFGFCLWLVKDIKVILSVS